MDREFPIDGGEMGRRIRAFDWNSTALGERASWPVELKTLVELMLGSSQPMFVVWGSERILLFNDAYCEILANKSDTALGRDILEVWEEIREDLLPIVEQVLRGEAVQNDDIELWIDRRGYREETHFSFSYTPVRDHTGQVRGFFCACQETTKQVVVERALRESEADARDNAHRVQLALDAGAIGGTWFWNLETDCISVDEAFLTAVGLDPDLDPDLDRDALRYEDFVKTVHPEDKADVAAAIERGLEKGGSYAIQYRVRRRDGRYYWIEANGRIDKGSNDREGTFTGVLLDMEERRRTELALQESSRRLDAILDNTREAVFLMDENQQCVYANRAAETLTGYSLEQMEGRPLHDVVHHTRPDGTPYPLDECPIDRAFPTRAQMQGEELFVAPDGSFYPVAFTASPVLDDDGSPIGTVIEARNIADEKAAELALRASEERLRFLSGLDEGLRDARDAESAMMTAAAILGSHLGASRCAYATVDDDNNSFTILDDYTAADVPSSVGQYSLDLFGSRASSSMRNGETLIVRDVGGEIGEGDGGGSFGELGIAAIICCPLVRDGQLRAMMAVHQDHPRNWTTQEISLVETAVERCWAHVERVHSQARLLQAEERYRLAVKATNDAVWDWDLSLDSVQWSDALLTNFGYGESVLSSTGGWWLDRIHPEDRTRVSDSIHSAIRGNAKHWQAEYRFRNAEGEDVHVIDRGFVIRDSNGKATRMVGALQDLTERRRSEQMLRTVNEELEQRVAEEMAERSKAEDALRQAQKMEAVGQLTGGIAHDFNNLLTIITGNVDMARRALQADENLNERADRALGNAAKGAERAASLTQRLLAFSRRQPLSPQLLRADRLVNDMSDLVRRSIGETIELRVEADPDLWQIKADPNQLEASILNLVVNARDAMPRGGTLTIGAANARPERDHPDDQDERGPGEYVVIFITDSGEGMAKDVLDRAFEPFFTTKEVGKGTGLGLSMVYGFTKQSGGYMEIVSDEGDGTTVRLFLPRAFGAVRSAKDEPKAVSETAGSKRCILVVEDDDDVRNYTAESLRELGYMVREANSGSAAVKVLEADGDEVDLVFSDVVMPGMTGRELARIVQRDFPEIRTLLTSGYTRDLAGTASEGSGNRILAKPFTFAELSREVSAVLQ
ncbi:PAS domain S-box protein [Sphingomicrobium sp. XHP0239]|uniref:PAS domain S-box protein n=1 Tax=Sphingomicrobium maritimum TaxID=3133972 RepID=UPI0031CCB532